MHVLITGASSGIGEALALHLGSLGHQQTLVARRGDLLDDLAGRIEAPCLVRPADLSNPATSAAVVEDARARFGHIDVLINNAGIQYVEPAHAIEPERIDRLMAVNLLTPLHFIHHLAPAMIARGEGTVVNICSMAGITPTPGMSHYSAAKAGLSAASETLRAELRHSGVHVLSVYPGPVASPMEAASRSNLDDTFMARHAPLGTATELARRIAKAIERRQARLFYPRVYGLSRHFRVTSQWLAESLTPKLRAPAP